MYTVAPKSEGCAIIKRLDKVRNLDGPLYTYTTKGLLLNIASATLLDKCINCPFGSKREYTISNGITELSCLKWGVTAEV